MLVLSMGAPFHTPLLGAAAAAAPRGGDLHKGGSETDVSGASGVCSEQRERRAA